MSAAPADARNDGLAVIGVALAVRLAWIAWAAPRFPPAGDGIFYHTLAQRIATGQGYTWSWPDGAVTAAAHYPVGYPALVAPFYALLGPLPAAAMVLNGTFGAAAALAMHALAWRATRSRHRAVAAGLIVALHPALVPYTAALMTEGLTASSLVIAAAVASSARVAARPWRVRALAGVTMGVATLVRPQCLLLAPVLGALATGAEARWQERLRSSVLVVLVAVGCCLPWTARNCVAMDRCALVSVNGGWNLLIGAQSSTGAWVPVDVPPECRPVWAEAAKDDCFGRVGVRAIVSNARAWVWKAPAKIAVTFDSFGAAPWYLHTSNPDAFSDGQARALNALEAVASRLLLVLALAASATRAGPRQPLRIVVAVASCVVALRTHGWPAYLVLAGNLALLGPRALLSAPLLFGWTGAVVALTALTHAVFFGAGRYGLVVAPFVGALGLLGEPRTLLARIARGAHTCHLGLRRRREGGRRPLNVAPQGVTLEGREESPSSTECDAG